jgi:hypothetical protein
MRSTKPSFLVVRGRCTVLLQANRRNILEQTLAISEAPTCTFQIENVN